MNKSITVKVSFDDTDGIVEIVGPSGLMFIRADNDEPTWKAVGDWLVLSVASFGKEAP